MNQRFWFATVVAGFRCSADLARRFDEALRVLELTHGQFSLLKSLNQPKPPAMSEVASRLAMDRTTLTAALKPFAAAYIGESGDRSGRSG